MRTICVALLCLLSTVVRAIASAKTCTLRPLGQGRDDSDQIEAAIVKCGHFGKTVFESGNYNVTRKMTWDLVSSKVDLHGYLNFKPDVEYWLNANNTYRVVFIQNQASWFVVTGRDFLIDAHNTGGIQGNGQTWWSFYGNRSRSDGDGRPIAFTLYKVKGGTVRNFRIESQPFWCNALAESSNVVYDGMYCNATNQDPIYAGQNIVPNTDGIDTYRADNVALLNWDITCGDDCLAIKGNSTHILAKNITCRGGTGIAVGSLGQYAQLSDIVDHVEFSDVKMIRLDPTVQPILESGVYFKTWTGTVNGAPPTGGGGGGGHVSNIVSRNFQLEPVDIPIHLYQTNLGLSTDAPSHLRFSNLSFINWSGSSLSNEIVDLECSPAVPCANMFFEDINITIPSGQAPEYVCKNVVNEQGLPACNATGHA